MQCEKCGFANPPGMRFCGQCAAPLKRICPSCGFANPADFGFCGQCAAALNDPPAAAQTPSQKSRETAERRQLTVLFCDMVGSTPLAERIDPEELRDIMRDYRNACYEVVARFDGHIAQYFGDGILVYFGYPQAHEDDARRAARTGLELVARIPELRYPQPTGEEVQLAVRVGIHTGLVVVGNMGDGDKRSLALGETPNLAARLQELAAPNSVVVSGATQRLIANDFDFHSLGEQRLKGFSNPVELYCVASERDFQPRRMTDHHATPLVGREQETALLQERLAQARQGVGQVVLLSGEAGLGKTRMVQMLFDALDGQPCYSLECAGFPDYRNSFLFPVIDLLRRSLGLAEIGEAGEKLVRLQQAIATLGLDEAPMVPVLAELLSIPVPNNPASAAGTTPHQKKRQILESLISLLQTLASRRLVVLVVEDLHWVDPSTLELLDLLMAQPGLGKLFVLFTFRSEFSPPWRSRAHLTQVTLNRLTRQQSGRLIRSLAKGKTLPPDVFQEILTKTDGVPYFVEELTNMVLDSDLLQEQADHYALTSSMAALAIPATLQDSLMSRLDSLGADKELAQLSATLGREFLHELLEALTERDDQSLQRGITHLIDSELFLRHGQPPSTRYSFRHALLREAAYQSLLRRTRQRYHQRIAALLQERFSHLVADTPELLAHHCTEAGMTSEALDHWLLAARRAVQRSANIEAAAHVSNGLQLLAQLPNETERKVRELALQTTLGLAMMMSQGYAAPAVEQAFARARALCHDLPTQASTFPVLCGLWEYYIVRADLHSAETLAEELRALANQSDDPVSRLEAQRILGTTRFWQGRLREAQVLLDSPGHSATPLLANQDAQCQDARVAALANAGCVQWLLGRPDLALELAQQALSLARRLGHPFSQAYALHFLSVVLQLRGDREAVRKNALTQITLCETYGFAFWVATGRMLQAWADGQEPAADAAASEAFQTALAQYEDSGSRLARSYFLALLAGLLQQEGKLAAAGETIRGIRAEVAHSGEGFFAAELLRINAEVQLADGDSAAAETTLQQAMTHAREQGAHSLALRAAIPLAQLWMSQGRQVEARRLLEEQLGRIEGGAASQDIQRATALTNN